VKKSWFKIKKKNLISFGMSQVMNKFCSFNTNVSDRRFNAKIVLFYCLAGCNFGE
jgi:hypothetical protein